MNIHYDVIMLQCGRSHSGQLVRVVRVGQGGGGRIVIAHMQDIQESAGSRQQDRLR